MGRWVKQRSTYERYYKVPVCWLEKDAREFSRLNRASWRNDPKMNTDNLENLHQYGLL